MKPSKVLKTFAPPKIVTIEHAQTLVPSMLKWKLLTCN